MPLTDNEYTKEHAKPPRRRSVLAEHARWSDTQKLECVTTYLMTGSVRMTANLLKIPEPTVASWKKTEWWADVVKEIESQENITLNNKLKKLVDKSLDLVADRLEHGDFIYDQKTGQIKRKPVVLRDVHKVAVDLINQKEKIRMTENVVVAQENVMSRLEKLNKSFEEFASKQAEKPPVVVTDVVFGSEPDNEGDDDAN